MRFKAVLFDLDGVVTDTAEFHYLAWRELADELGIPMDRAFNERLKGVSRMESLERILRHGGRELTYTDEEKRRLAERKNARYVRLLSELTPAHTLPGIRELLTELQSREIPAVLVSASKNAPQILYALGLEASFRDVVDPDSGRGKPEPDLFLRGAALAGVEPADCVGIEDAAAGIQALRAAGMTAVGIGDAAILKAAGADVVLESTSLLTLPFLDRL